MTAFQLPLIEPDSDWAPPEVLPDPPRDGVLGLDTETRDPELSERGPGVRRPGCHVVGVSLAHPALGGSVYLPFRHEGGGNLDPNRVLAWLRDLAKNFRGTVQGANLLYDLDFLEADDVRFDLRNVGLEDALLAEPLLDENRRSYKLDDVATDRGLPGKDLTLLLEAGAAYGLKNKTQVMSNLWRLPSRFVGPYAERDAELPGLLLERQKPLLESEGLDPIWDVESRLVPVLLRMRQRGVRVDVARAETVGRKLRALYRDKLAAARRLAGCELEPWAVDSFGRAILDRGLQPPRTPKTRQLSITKEWLARHKEDDLVAAVLELRRLDKADSTFVRGHLLGNLVDGRVHCEFNQLKGEGKGAVARLSSSNPNLQQVPARDEEMARLIRGCFLPEEGEAWETLDFSQIQFRLLVHYSRGAAAERAREAYRTDPKTDFHKLTAELCGIDPEDKIARKRVKNTNFGAMFGAGVDRTADTLSIPREEAAEFLEDYHEALPFVRKSYEDVDRRAAARGYVKTVLGRRQRFPFWERGGWTPREEREAEGVARTREEAVKRFGSAKRAGTYRALCLLLQGSEADVAKKTLVDVWDSGAVDVLGAPLLTVHDEDNWSRPRTGEAEEAVEHVRHLMESAVELSVPVYADRASGPNWGEVK